MVDNPAIRIECPTILFKKRAKEELKAVIADNCIT
jgi:hypothetical protein